MTVIVAIDPGKTACGVAIAVDGVLVKAGYPTPKKYRLEKPPREVVWARSVHAANDFLRIEHAIGRIDRLVIEMPKVYPGMPNTDLNDLLDLAAVVGGLLEVIYYNEARLVHPQEWKGQVPKKVMNARVLSKLSSAEQATIEYAGAKTHNTLDAVGILLYDLGRLK